MPKLSVVEPMLNPVLYHFPQFPGGYHSANWYKLIALDHFPLEGAVLFSLEQTLTLIMNCPLLLRLLPKTFIQRFIENLTQHHDIPHSFVLIRDIVSYHLSHHPGAVLLIAWWSGFLKTQLGLQLVRTSEIGSSRMQCILQISNLYVALLFLVKILWSKNQCMERKTLLTISFCIPLAIFFFFLLL